MLVFHMSQRLGRYVRRQGQSLAVMRASVFVVLVLLVPTVMSALSGTVHAETGACVAAQPLSFKVRADAADNYTAWARIRTASDAQVSLSLGKGCNVAEALKTDTWTWVRFSEPLALQQGEQTAAISSSGEVQVDKLLFMVDGSCVPQGSYGDNCVLENISISLGGIENEVSEGAALRISAEIHGAKEPKVSFTFDDKGLTSSGGLQGDDVYCAVITSQDICGVLPSTLLGVGTHSVSVTVVDGERTSSATANFAVTLASQQTSLSQKLEDTRAGLERGNTVSSLAKTADNSTPPAIDKNTHGSENAPIFVIGQGSVLSDTVSGVIGLSVPANLLSDDAKTVTYYVDDQRVGSARVQESPFLYDTAGLNNHGHQFKAVIDGGNSQNSTVEITAVVNNNPFNTIKNWVARPGVRLSLAVACGALSLVALYFTLRSHIRAKRHRAVTGANTQPLRYVPPTHIGPRGYAVLAFLTLTTLGAALVVAPATPAYIGNASVVVELEDARLNYDHETATDTTAHTTYIILR